LINVVPQVICLAGTCADQDTATMLLLHLAANMAHQEMVVVYVSNALQIPHAQVLLAPKLFARQ
jgi:hypothetical protein